MQARLFNNAQALMQNNCQKTCKTTFYILYLCHQSARIGRSRYLHSKKDGGDSKRGPHFICIDVVAYWGKIEDKMKRIKLNAEAS